MNAFSRVALNFTVPVLLFSSSGAVALDHEMVLTNETASTDVQRKSAAYNVACSFPDAACVSKIVYCTKWMKSCKDSLKITCETGDIYSGDHKKQVVDLGTRVRFWALKRNRHVLPSVTIDKPVAPFPVTVAGVLTTSTMSSTGVCEVRKVSFTDEFATELF